MLSVDPLTPVVDGRFAATKNRKVSQKRALPLTHGGRWSVWQHVGQVFVWPVRHFEACATAEPQRYMTPVLNSVVVP